MTPGQSVLYTAVIFAAGVLGFMLGYLLAMVMAVSGRVSRDEEPMLPGEHEHLRKE